MSLTSFQYNGSSGVKSTTSSSEVSFMPDLLRPPTFFNGEIGQNILFREAISALHKVVVNDQRYVPPDRSAYLEWRKKQNQIDLENVQKHFAKTQEELQYLLKERTQLQDEARSFFHGFEDAIEERRWENFKEFRRIHWYWFCDPVITVHPDELFFECFSFDESSYGKLSLDYEVFSKIDEFECGTTNIDYSHPLYDAFQKIRTYKKTNLVVDPSGFTVKTQGEDDFTEKKIPLPETWVRGFTQVSAAMNLPADVLRLHPTDILMICQYLRKRKEKIGPRSLRFFLRVGKPVSVMFEPWNEIKRCHRSIYLGTEDKEIRIWGRRRFHILERLIPIANHFDLHLLGRGMPYFFIVPLHENPVFNSPISSLTFTLGLSSWGTNNFSQSANFDLMQSKTYVAQSTMNDVYSCLKTTLDWRSTPKKIAQELRLDEEIVKSSLFAYARAGYVIYDSNKKQFRARELFREGPQVENMFALSATEMYANRLIENGNIQGFRVQEGENKLITAYIRQDGKVIKTQLCLNKDDEMVGKQCYCACVYFSKNQLRKGPCHHLIAVKNISESN